MGTPPARLSEAQRDELDALALAITQVGGVPCSGDDLTISESDADQQEGIHWCARCPILDTCRAYGLAWPEEIERRRALVRERSRRARARRKQRTEGTAA